MLPDLDVIKLWRKRAGFTQKELSKLSGLSQSYINKIENLISEPPYGVAKRIIELLNNARNERERLNGKNLMTKIKTISSSLRLSEAISLMDELGVSQLPVVNSGLIVGSITKNTVLKLVKKRVKYIESQRINDVMDSPFPMIPEDSSIQLISILLEFNEAVLLLNKGRFSGIITKHDIIKAMQK